MISVRTGQFRSAKIIASWRLGRTDGNFFKKGTLSVKYAGAMRRVDGFGLSGRQNAGTAPWGKPEVRPEHQRAAVILVAAHEVVGRKRWVSRLECGMRVDDARRGVEPRLRDAGIMPALRSVGHCREHPAEKLIQTLVV